MRTNRMKTNRMKSNSGNHRKKIRIASGMAVLLAVTSALPVSAAAAAPQGKEEVVYITLDADGKLKNTYVVNSFSGGEITDYGDYASVKMLNVSDPVEQKGDKITILSSAEKVYYQGQLKDSKIPWNISLHYYLDGKEYTPGEIAGKSGKLKIRMQIEKNGDCSGTFFEDYALQASLSLDTKQCSNITASDAVIANAGSSKLLSYTILPGKGIDTEITADVNNFEMSEISINGIHLNLNVEIEDKELKDKVNELIDAVEKLDDGAVKLCDGSGELLTGSSELKDGVSSLHGGSAALDEGVATLRSGLGEVQSGLNRLNSQSSALIKGSSEFKAAMKQIQTAVSSVSAAEEDLTEFVTTSGQIKQAVGALHTGASALQEKLGYAQYKALMAQNGLSIDELAAGNANAIEIIRGYEGLLETVSQMPQYKDVAAQYKSSVLQTAEQVIGLLNTNNAALGGMETYLNGVSAELPALTNGLSELNAQYETFDASVHTLVTGLGSMTGNLSKLADGINQLAENYEKLDSGIGSYTDGVAQIAAGYSQVMTGVSSLAEGSKELVSGSEELYGGTAELYDGVVSLCDGAKDMAEGTGEFRTETSDMNEKIDEEIDGILDTIGGSMDNPVSFVSEKNTNVESVQFVIRTDAVQMEEIKEEENTEKEEPSLREKFVNLFK